LIVSFLIHSNYFIYWLAFGHFSHVKIVGHFTSTLSNFSISTTTEVHPLVIKTARTSSFSAIDPSKNTVMPVPNAK
jgi:hypothetical protein